jgi:hypothetical protein
MNYRRVTMPPRGGALLSASSNRTAEVLRRTLMRIQSGKDAPPDDPSLRELRRTLILQIAALENKDHNAQEIGAQ